ncbi:MAG: NosD domain-containing protein [Planctomycetota bacterium]
MNSRFALLAVLCLALAPSSFPAGDEGKGKTDEAKKPEAPEGVTQEAADAARAAIRKAGLDPKAEIVAKNGGKPKMSSKAQKAVREAGFRDMSDVVSALEKFPEDKSSPPPARIEPDPALPKPDGGEPAPAPPDVPAPPIAPTPPPSGKRIAVPGDHPTVQAAVDAAGPGDVISLKTGKYQERVYVTGKKAGLVIESADPAAPAEILGTPNASRDGIRVDQVDGGVIRNLRILGAYDGVRLNNVNGARLLDLYIENSALGIRVNGGEGNRIERCKVVKSRVEQAVTIDGAPKTVVIDTAISDGERENLRAVKSPGLVLERVTATASRAAGGIKVDNCGGARIEGCTATDNYSDGIYVAGSPDLKFTGNKASKNHAYGLRLEKSPPLTDPAAVTAAGNEGVGNSKGDVVAKP